MSLYDKIAGAMRNRKIEELTEQLHDDFRFISHKDGNRMDRQTFTEMVGNFMSSDALEIHSQRCVYENDDIIVSHTLMDFPDGTREAVMTVHKLKDGKIIETETGATPVAK